MSQAKCPDGWDAERVRRVLESYGQQAEDEAVAEDEAGYHDRTQSLIEVPVELVPTVRELIAKHKKAS